MISTAITELNVQIHILKQQIAPEASNYKYAMELRKDFETLSILRKDILKQKKIRYTLIKQAAESNTQMSKNKTQPRD